VKIYDAKEQMILDKYEIPKEDYAASLKKYSQEKNILSNTKEIFDMLERAIRGEVPDLTVNPRVPI